MVPKWEGAGPIPKRGECCVCTEITTIYRKEWWPEPSTGLSRLYTRFYCRTHYEETEDRLGPVWRKAEIVGVFLISLAVMWLILYLWTDPKLS